MPDVGFVCPIVQNPKNTQKNKNWSKGGRPSVKVDEKQLESMIKQGRNKEEIAQILGVHPNTLKNRYKEIKEKVKQEKINRITKMIESGYSEKEIAFELEITTRYVKKVKQETGKYKEDLIDVNRIREMASSGASDLEIAELLNISRTTVYNKRAELGIPSGKGHGGARENSGPAPGSVREDIIEYVGLLNQQAVDAKVNSIDAGMQIGITVAGNDWLKWARSAFELDKKCKKYVCKEDLNVRIKDNNTDKYKKRWMGSMPKHISTYIEEMPPGTLLEDSYTGLLQDEEKLHKGSNRRSGKGNISDNIKFNAVNGY